MVTIRAVPQMVDALDWRWGFAFLALGPAAGIWSIRRLRVVQALDSANSALEG